MQTHPFQYMFHGIYKSNIYQIYPIDNNISTFFYIQGIFIDIQNYIEYTLIIKHFVIQSI
jgi:hypothetical protein